MSPVIRTGSSRPPPAASHRPGVVRPPIPSRSHRPAVLQGGKVPGARKIVHEILPSFSRQLSAMLTAGMPIVSALEALEEQTDHSSFKAVLRQIRHSIEGGAAFSEALRLFPSVFDELYANMVRGGESGGQLAETIARLAGFLEAAAKLRRRIKSALMYPVIVLCLALAIGTAMVVFIVPVFGNMYADFGARLPGPTQALLDLSGFLRAYGLYLGAGVGVAAIAFRWWKKQPKGAYAWDRFRLKLPVLGELTRKIVSGRFARTFAQLTRSGVPILNALEISAGATGNKAAERIVLVARVAVEKGEPLSSALLNQTVFPILMVRMLQAGEKTGRVDEMMNNIADFYEDEVEAMLAGLTSLLEPILMIFLGVVIGSLVLCLFLPIFRMSEIVAR